MKKNMTPGPMMQHVHAQHIVMVCVTRQRTCVRLVERGEAIAAERKLPLHVVHAVGTGENFLGNADEGEALEYLFTVAQLSGGELSMLRCEDVESTLVEYARAHAAAALVMGASPGNGDDSFCAHMRARLPGVEIEVVPEKPKAFSVGE